MSTPKVTKGSRHKPYDRASRDQYRVSAAYTQPSGSMSTRPSQPKPSSTSNPAKRTVRGDMLSGIRKRFPGFKPRHDFDILAVSDGRYKGPEKDIYAWVDQELASMARDRDSTKLILDGARDMMSAEGFVTGVKPESGDLDPGVFIRPIPRSPYSIRLFPGSPVMQEYCLDFVETATGRPMNSPFKFELWQTGYASMPLGTAPAMRLRSIESAFGYAQKDILPGEERFVLRDGMTCRLKRPGHKDLRFTVPIRQVAAAPEEEDVDEVDLPLHISQC